LNEEILAIAIKRIEALERVWVLVEGAESEGQGFIPTSAVRAAIKGVG